MVLINVNNTLVYGVYSRGLIYLAAWINIYET